MKNAIVCKQCNTENPFFQHICLNCKSYLRERVVNLDLWNVISRLIESPVKGFSQVVHSEHKNFVVSLILIAAIKFLLYSVFLSVAAKSDSAVYNFFPKYMTVLLFLSIYLYSFSYILTFINSKFGINTRVKDNFSIFTYSFIPQVFALLILFPLELIIFGGYLFSYDPSPFLLKSSVAYTLLVIEFLIILWSIFLNIMAIYTQSKSIRYSLCVALLFNLFLYLGLFLFSKMI